MDKFIISRRSLVVAATLGPTLIAQRLAAQQGGLVSRAAVVDGLYGPAAITAINSEHLTIGLAKGGDVWKGGWGKDFTSLIPGDNIVARGYLTPNGLSAVRVWANITSFWGVVNTVGRSDYSVTTIRGVTRSAFVTANTVSDIDTLQPFDMNDLRPGRSVQTVGLRMPDGTVQATLAIVYVAGRPIVMPPEALVRTPGGQFVQARF